MVITKYAVVDAPLQDGINGAFDSKALSEAMMCDVTCTIYDTREAAMDAISEYGFSTNTYIVPLAIDVSEICQVKLSFDTVFK